MFTDGSLFSNAPEHTAGAQSPLPVAKKPLRPASGRVGLRRLSESGEHSKLLNHYVSDQIHSDSEETVIPTKLIFTDHKLFWQIKGTIDFHLFEHVDSNPCRLELVPYDKSSGEELEHVYLSKALILPRVQLEVQRRMELKQAALRPVRRSSKGGSPKLESMQSISSFSESDALIADDVTNEVIGEYILARTLVVPADGADKMKVRVKQTSSELSDPSKLNIITQKPCGKSDLTIYRPRRASFVEFDNVLQSFNSDAEVVQHSTSCAALFTERNIKAFEKLDSIKARPRAMSIDELKDLELRARKGPEQVMLTSKERWLQTIQTIQAKRSRDSNDSRSSSPAKEPSTTSSPARRSRAERETFPNPFTPLPAASNWADSSSPGKIIPVSERPNAGGPSKWNSGTKASPLNPAMNSNGSSPSKAPSKLPPRPSWNASPARRRPQEPLGGIAPMKIPPMVM